MLGITGTMIAQISWPSFSTFKTLLKIKLKLRESVVLCSSEALSFTLSKILILTPDPGAWASLNGYLLSKPDILKISQINSDSGLIQTLRYFKLNDNSDEELDNRPV